MPSFVDRAAPEPEWKAIHRIADRRSGRMRRAFEAATVAARRRFPLGRMTEAIAVGFGGTFEVHVFVEDISSDVIRPFVDDALEAGGVTAARQMAPLHKRHEATLAMAFDATDPLAVAWAETHTARLVTRISERQREAIRLIIARALDEGIQPRETARLIRAVIGLDARRAGALASLRETWVEAGLSSTRIDQLVERQSARLVRQRATTIARTELLTATNRGQELAWEQGVRVGALDPRVMHREWIVTPDDRLCPICRPMDGVTVAIGEPWQTDNGPVTTPTEVHPACRCAQGLVDVSQRRRAA